MNLLKSLLTLFLFLPSVLIKAQNLVVNPSLEQYFGNNIPGWSVVAGSPDIASKQNQIVFPPTSGSFNPYYSNRVDSRLDSIRFGEICLCQGFNSQWTEVSQVELAQPLKKGEKYKVSLYAIKVDTSNRNIEEVSVHLSKKPLYQSGQPFGYEVDFIELQPLELFSVGSRKWIRYSAVFEASKRFKYLSIGNFLGANKDALEGLEGPVRSLYYCYDKLEVVSVGEHIEIANKRIPPLEPRKSRLEDLYEKEHKLAIRVDTTIVFFEFDHFNLNQKAAQNLATTYDKIKNLEVVKVQIIGLTDSIGPTEYNAALSEMRATNVKQYLIGLGIAEDKITMLGAGEILYLKSNKTIEGRQKNRSVLIQFLLDE